VLRAAHSAPSAFIAELKRSADLFGIVFVRFQFSVSFSPELVILVIESLRLRFGIVILSSRLLLNGEFYAKKKFSKTGSCREAAKISKKT
jgi:hypothetical protein